MGIMAAWLKGFAPFAAMVMVECLDIVSTTMSKAAMTKGINHFAFVVYTNALATIIFLPIFICHSHRKKTPTPLTFSLLSKFFLLSFVGITLVQNCAFAGISYSSPTLESALSSLAPAFTFILAVFFKMEKLDLKNRKGMMKVMGTVLSIAGALIITIYKGPAILPPLLHSGQNTYSTNSVSMILGATNNWIFGGLIIVVGSLCFSIWNIGQAAILERYPSEITILFYYFFFGTIQCALLTLIVGEGSSVWALTPNIELISVLYSGIFGSVVPFSVITWCIKKKGPVFTAMFQPLGIAIAAFISSIFLGEALYIGSVIGAVLIVIGFYGVIWSQSVEGKDETHGVVDGLQSVSPLTPLLES
ncbi:WAT1-related protein At4g15540-like isoform X2 [Cannabis sativa]|uniref:WAT1-related protein At4g15540-like isoform X2 n=1 Tax=Cannabis sativa TaxID=3483 RepID=UPI0029CA90DA|nr:WAT1-related protein At4g15540-like isoform X2 [Cannabis sativa]